MTRPSLLRAIAIAAVLWTTSAAAPAAESPVFRLPVDCTPGRDCAVQTYVDHDPEPGATDFTCGSLTYDGHKGTDIRLGDRAALERKIAVLAAADGTVLRVRDGLPDIGVHDRGAPSVAGREAGNSVIIDHGGGWHTQYGHLRQGSIVVQPGQSVVAGAPIGAIGLSGQTEFPHVHFEVRHDGQTVDPFTGPLDSPGCGQQGQPLWTAQAAAALAYRPTGLLAAGLVGTAPDGDSIRAGAYANAVVGPDSDAMVLWVSIYGVQAGDRQTFTIEAPDGTVLVEKTRELPGAKAEWRAWAGHRKPAFGWPRGTYNASYRLVRGDETVVEVIRKVELR